MIVGEAPGEKEVEQRRPFVGASGWLLNELLTEAGLTRQQAFVTNVCRQRPPGNEVEAWIATTQRARTLDHRLLAGKWVLPQIIAGRDLLLREVALVQPRVVVAFGNLALWALTGKWGIRKWRGSRIPCVIEGHSFDVVPTIHPAAVMREWAIRPLLVQDLRRAREVMGKPTGWKPGDNRFIIRPNFDQATTSLSQLLLDLAWTAADARGRLPIAADIETRAGHIACTGLAWSRWDAICIPWMSVERPEGYWALDEETHLVELMRAILTHPWAEIIWQNGAYDHQYIHRWHFYLPSLGWDTMLAHHAMFSISLKSLDHLSSLYCEDHLYWKEDGKTWDPSLPEDQLWEYNCQDCVRTWEIAQEEKVAAYDLTNKGGWPKLPSVMAFQHSIQPVIVKMMLRGVRSDETTRARMEGKLTSAITRIQAELDDICGEHLNINSPQQITKFFYGTLHQSPLYRRNPDGTRGSLTADDDALDTLRGKEPLLRPVVDRIQALRSATKFLSTYVRMPRDTDGRLRCSYNVAGTKTYRLASSENAFGSGGNLQNIPSGDEDEENPTIALPNILRLFLFDPGYTGFDLDGDSADLRIVTGESGCRQMQAYFQAGVKPYVEIAKEFYRDPTITKSHPSYKRMKALCHGSNYGGEPPGLAERIGLPIHDVERMQRWYFGMCPEIQAWQAEIRTQCEKRGWIENPFGYRLYRWDRYSRKLANEFLAWTPQSTVGILINKIALEIDQQLPHVQLLLQVHDSLVGQWPSQQEEAGRIKAIAEGVVIPCRTGPITVPAGIKVSNKSWGECA